MFSYRITINYSPGLYPGAIYKMVDDSCQNAERFIKLAPRSRSRYICTICNEYTRPTNEKSRLLEHIRIHLRDFHLNRITPTLLAAQTAPNNANNSYLEAEEIDFATIGGRKKMFQCILDGCTCLFRSTSELNRHEKTHQTVDHFPLFLKSSLIDEEEGICFVRSTLKGQDFKVHVNVKSGECSNSECNLINIDDSLLICRHVRSARLGRFTECEFFKMTEELIENSRFSLDKKNALKLIQEAADSDLKPLIAEFSESLGLGMGRTNSGMGRTNSGEHGSESPNSGESKICEINSNNSVYLVNNVNYDEYSDIPKDLFKYLASLLTNPHDIGTDKIILRKERNFHSGTNSFRLLIQNEIHKFGCPKCASNSSLMSKGLVKGNIWRVGCIKCKQSSSGAQLCKQLSFSDFMKALKCYPTLEFSKIIRWLKILPGKFKKNDEVIPKFVPDAQKTTRKSARKKDSSISKKGKGLPKSIKFVDDQSKKVNDSVTLVKRKLKEQNNTPATDLPKELKTVDLVDREACPIPEYSSSNNEDKEMIIEAHSNEDNESFKFTMEIHKDTNRENCEKSTTVPSGNFIDNCPDTIIEVPTNIPETPPIIDENTKTNVDYIGDNPGPITNYEKNKMLEHIATQLNEVLAQNKFHIERLQVLEIENKNLKDALCLQLQPSVMTNMNEKKVAKTLVSSSITKNAVKKQNLIEKPYSAVKESVKSQIGKRPASFSEAVGPCDEPWCRVTNGKIERVPVIRINDVTIKNSSMPKGNTLNSPPPKRPNHENNKTTSFEPSPLILLYFKNARFISPADVRKCVRNEGFFSSSIRDASHINNNIIQILTYESSAKNLVQALKKIHLNYDPSFDPINITEAKKFRPDLTTPKAILEFQSFLETIVKRLNQKLYQIPALHRSINFLNKLKNSGNPYAQAVPQGLHANEPTPSPRQ